MRKMNMGGSVPRQTTIQGQRHDLAYINPFEVDLLQNIGGAGAPGPGGVPAFYFGGGGQEAPSEGFGYSSPGEGPGGPPNQQKSNSQIAADQLAKANTPEIQASNKAAMDKAVNVAEIQKSIVDEEEAIAKKKGLAKIYAQVTSKPFLDQKKAAVNELLGQYQPSKFQGALQKAGLAGTPVNFTPAYDQQGNLVGSAGLDKDGNVVSYSGDRNANFADPDVQGHVDGMNAAGDLSGNPDTNPNIGPPDLPPIDMDPCPAGFVMDAETNVCVPVTPTIDPDLPEVPDEPLPPYVPPSEVVGQPNYTPIGGLGSFVPTPLQPYQPYQPYQIQPQPMVTMMLGEEQG